MERNFTNCSDYYSISYNSSMYSDDDPFDFRSNVSQSIPINYLEYLEHLEKEKNDFDAINNFIADGKTAFKMGSYYLSRKEYSVASLLFRVGAHKGDTRCLTNCGFMYYNGLGVEQKNTDLAKLYYEKATQLGDEKAKYNLAMTLVNDRKDFEKNRNEAIKLFKEIAKKNCDASLMLGRIYENDKNFKEAEKYYKLGFKLLEKINKQMDKKNKSLSINCD